MPHPKEHPLAHRVVVPHYATDPNAAVYVIDWLDRLPEEMRLLTSDTGPSLAYRARTRGQDLPDSGVVLAGDGRGRCLVHHTELPAYEFEPVGTVS